MSKIFNFSPSKLNVLAECARCFWLQEIHKRKRPSGPFPSITRGFDAVLKTYLDEYRGGMPPELKKDISGQLFSDSEKLEKWRNWRTGLVYETKATLKETGETARVILSGALDDLVVHEGKFSPLDAKTKNAHPKTNGAEYYQLQLDCYSLMLSANGMQPSGHAYLWYVWPETWSEPEMDISRTSVLDCGSKVFVLDSEPERAAGMLKKAVAVLTGPIPQPDPRCDFCAHVETVKSIEEQMGQLVPA